MPQLILSIFPGIDLLGMAFEEEGFTVVRGPDVLWGGDVKAFHGVPRRFDGVIGGPPCKRHSRLRHMVIANGYELAEDLIPEFERIVGECQPIWFVMENVPEAPVPTVPGYEKRSYLLRDDWVGGLTMRLRRFTFGSTESTRGVPARLEIEQLAMHTPASFPAVTGPGRVKLVSGGKVKGTIAKLNPTIAEACERQGLPADFLEQAPFTATAKRDVIGQGVPLPMGRAIAKAVKRALNLDVA